MIESTLAGGRGMYDRVVRECSLEEVLDLKTKWHGGSLLKAKRPRWREQQMQKNGNRARPGAFEGQKGSQLDWEQPEQRSDGGRPQRGRPGWKAPWGHPKEVVLKEYHLAAV